MKNVKIFLASIALLCSATASAQTSDFSINVQMLPGTCTLGDTVVLDVQVLNSGDFVYPANSLVATINAPNDCMIIGFTDTGAMAAWQVTNIVAGAGPNGGGNQYTLVNTQSFPEYAEAYPSLKVVATSLGTAVANQATSYLDKNTGFGSVPDDLTTNNSSSTSLTVQEPAPLNFLSINAAWLNNDALLKWNVAEEMANAYFSIERSFDGKDFKEVGQVKSIGDHKNIHTYTFVHANAKSQTTDKIYYRVRQVDIGGKSTLTSIVQLLVNDNKEEAFVFPNPLVGEHFNFVYQNSNIKDAELNIHILDAQGRLVRNVKAIITNGKNQIIISTKDMPGGIYYLNYFNDENSIKGSIKIVKE